MQGEDGQVDENETDSDYDKKEIEETGIDTDELALITVQSKRISGSKKDKTNLTLNNTVTTTDFGIFQTMFTGTRTV